MLEWTFGYLQNYSGEPIKGFIEDNIPKRREDFSDIDDIVSGYKIFDDDELITFESFYEDSTQFGIIPFEISDCCNTRVAIFETEPTKDRVSDLWRINLTLRLEPLIAKVDKIRITKNDKVRITRNGKIRACRVEEQL